MLIRIRDVVSTASTLSQTIGISSQKRVWSNKQSETNEGKQNRDLSKTQTIHLQVRIVYIYRSVLCKKPLDTFILLFIIMIRICIL